MAEHPSRTWFHVACLRGSREGHLASSHAVECAASERSHLRCGGRLCKGTNVTGPKSATTPPDAKCASTEAPSPDRFWVNISRLVRKRALTVDDLYRRRNLPNAASTDSSVAIGRCCAAIRSIGSGGRVCRSSSAIA